MTEGEQYFLDDDDKFKKNILPKYKQYLLNLKSLCSSRLTSKSPENFGEEYWCIIERASNGHIPSFVYLANLLLTDSVFPSDKPQARDMLYDLAFNSGSLPQKFPIYFFAKSSLGIGEYDEALHLLNELTESDYLPAYALLGNMYQFGSGVEANYHRADNLYKYASQRGHGAAKVLRAKMQRSSDSIVVKFIGTIKLITAFFWNSYLGFLVSDNYDVRKIY